MFRYGLVLAFSLWTASWASAASWADGLFDELSKDFGPVPRGPTLTHSFHLVNRTAAPIHVAGIRVSCGCVTATVGRDELAPGQETSLVAQMDTRRFSGAKAVTIYVQFDRPQWEEVRLWVQAYGRDDVSVNPESFALGRVRRGSAPGAEVEVTLYGTDWHVTGARSDSNYVIVHVADLARPDGATAYRVDAKLRADAPVGRWFTDVWLLTNNPQAARFRIPLTVEIESALSVSPAIADMGDVKTGAEVERRVVVRGVKPFRVLRVEGSDRQLVVKDSSSEAKAVHVLTLHFKPETTDNLARTLRIVTDLKDDNYIDFRATAKVGQ